MLRTLFFLILITTFVSCGQEKEALNNRYHELVARTSSAVPYADTIFPYLNEQSVQLIQDLADTSKLSLDRFIRIGEEHDCPLYFALMYYSLGDYLKTPLNTSWMFLFMHNMNTPGCNNKDIRLLPERTVAGRNARVELGYSYGLEKAILTTLRYTKNREGDYQLDLPSAFSLNEKFIRIQLWAFADAPKEKSIGPWAPKIARRNTTWKEFKRSHDYDQRMAMLDEFLTNHSNGQVYTDEIQHYNKIITR